MFWNDSYENLLHRPLWMNVPFVIHSLLSLNLLYIILRLITFIRLKIIGTIKYRLYYAPIWTSCTNFIFNWKMMTGVFVQQDNGFRMKGKIVSTVVKDAGYDIMWREYMTAKWVLCCDNFETRLDVKIKF